jgi:hypothetical protein
MNIKIWLLWLYNIWSYKNLNNIELNATDIGLFSISRYNYQKYKFLFGYVGEYEDKVAIYNKYYGYYKFNNVKYITYDAVLDAAINLKY